MAYFWLENLDMRKLCPRDYKSLHKVKYQFDATDAPTQALHCPFCGGTFVPYISAEIAARHKNVSLKFLGEKAREEIQYLLRKAEYEKAKQKEAQRRAEQKRKNQKMEEEQRLLCIQREQRAALRAKKELLIEQIKSLFESNYFAAEEFFEANNSGLLTRNEFMQLQEEYIDHWFNNLVPPVKFLPDEKQRIAIGATQKNIEVIARAGSGKTATLVNRFLFLTKHCKIDASTMLLLAFNRKAVHELQEKINGLLKTYPERISGMPHIMTFHALARSIVHPEEKLLYDDEEAGSREFSRMVQSIIDEKLRDIVWASKIRSIMLSHFKGNWEAIEFGGHNLTKEEQVIYRRSIPNQSLNGDYVKSYGEKIIANILFEHDVEYKYEQHVPWANESYKPDFAVSQSDKRQIFIEYFGYVGDPKYDEQIQEKLRFWSKRKECLIKIYPEEIARDHSGLISKLLAAFEDNGVHYRKLTEEEIWEKIKERAIDEFTKTVGSFIGRCRKMELSVDDLNSRIHNHCNCLPTEKLFLETACSIYEDFLLELKRRKLEDFDGLISRATADVRDGRTSFGKRDKLGDLRSLSYIMIDEYQDFSYLFDNFLAAIRSVCPSASIFCVGDDWQAINAFAGSDVKYFQQFTERYENSSRYYLTTNYRSRKEIVYVGSRLMSKGERDKSIIPAKPGSGTVSIGYLTDFVASTAEKSIHKHDVLTPAILRLVSNAFCQEKNVVLLTRTNWRLPLHFTGRADTKALNPTEQFLASIRSFFPPEERARITVSTTHKYKGKEEDVVIILDAAVSFYPLIHPSWIFQRVFGDTIDKLVEEEKRLFYVAVSRAKDELYILTSKGEESPFIGSLGNLSRINWDHYAPLVTDDASVKVEVSNQEGYMSYPYPTYSIKNLLKDEGYQWDKKRVAWYHHYPQMGFDIKKILEQSWTRSANHVVVTQYNKNNQLEDAYLIADGSIIRLRIDDFEREQHRD